MKKFIALLLAVVLVTSITVSGSTIAYLSNEDAAVNVMTTGDVYIEQIEQERDENGNLVPFKQEQPAYPAVGTVKWADTGVKLNGSEYKVFTADLKNVVDKIVTVKNTGSTDAYVRTIIAIEAPDFDPKDLIHVNINEVGVTHTAWTPVVINGTDYVYSVFTYSDALEPKEISPPSLLQVFLDSKTTNKDVAKFGNAMEILVLSQGTQAAGYADAQTALDSGLGVLTTESVKLCFENRSHSANIAETQDAQ